MRNSSLSSLATTLLMLMSCRHETSMKAWAFSPDLPGILQDLHNQNAPLIHNVASTLSHYSSNEHFQHILPYASSSTTHLASAVDVSSMDNVFHHTQDFLSSLYSKYRQALDAKPLQTKIMTGCTLAIVGDAIAQKRDPTAEYDLKRAASFVAFDGCWRAVQVGTYKPLIETCTGQFSLNLLKHVLPNTFDEMNPYLFGAMEQTLVSQLVLIPGTYQQTKLTLFHLPHSRT